MRDHPAHPRNCDLADASERRPYPASQKIWITDLQHSMFTHMLQTLRIKNLALVENITIDFEPGLNVITGETGAGKSVLIGALGLLLGGRADKTMIRTGEEQCGSEALFHLDHPEKIDAILQESGLDPCASGDLVIRRIISSNGTSKNYINGSPATLHTLKSIGDLLVDIHGPHDHQSLLSTDFQLDVLDAFGQLTDQRAAYIKAYTSYRDLQAQRHALDGDDQSVARQIDLLRFQCDEIKAAALVVGEDEEVERDHRLAANAQRIISLTDGIRRVLTDDEASADNALAAVHKFLNELKPLIEKSRAWKEQAESISIQLRDLSEDIAREVNSIETDPARMQWLDERLTLYQKMKRKYRPTVAEILAFYEDIMRQLHDLENRDAQIAELDAQIAQSLRKVEKSGKELGQAREKAAALLAKAITKQLRDLGFPGSSFDVSLTEIEPSPQGMNAIEFTFAPNVGEAIRPLRAIASSGEISRVMLAIKAVLAGHDRIPVLVFDEIDANIGGEMGLAVGAKLTVVAKAHQVICITHLSQVAAFGTTHYAVGKEVVGGRTRTYINRLSAEARVEEIARMLGGKESTAYALKHARELLKSIAGN